MATVLTSLDLIPTMKCIGVYANFSGSGGDSALMEVRTPGGVWSPGGPIFKDTRASIVTSAGSVPNPWANQWRGSILWRNPNTTYEVLVTIFDPDGNVSATQFITTLDENIPESTGETVYVPGDFPTVSAAALYLSGSGGTIRITGDIDENAPSNSFSASGIPSNFITIESDPANPGTWRATGGGTDLSDAFLGNNCNYLRFRNIAFENAGRTFIRLRNSDWIVIEDCTFRNFRGTRNYQGHIRMDDQLGDATNRSWIIRRNKFYQEIPIQAAGGEAFAIYMDNSGGRHMVYGNEIYGGDYLKDGIGGATNSRLYGGPGPDTDIYDNIFWSSWDDAVELDGNGCNLRCWGNRIMKDTGNRSNISFAPVGVGPIYVGYNELRNSYPGDTYLIKSGGGGSMPSDGFAVIWNNTGYGANRGFVPYGNTNRFANQIYKNNIIVCHQSAYNGTTPTSPGTIMDHDLFWKLPPFVAGEIDFYRWDSLFWEFGDLASFVAATGGHELHGEEGDPLFYDELAGDFRLNPGSPAIGTADPIPGLTIGMNKGSTDYFQGPPPLPPVAIISAIPTSGPAPLTVQFNNLSTGEISSWLWDFGDGTTSSAQNPQKTYNVDGIYTVNLHVEGPYGFSDDYININVRAVAVTYMLDMRVSPINMPQGYISPPEGIHSYDEGTVVQVDATPSPPGWQFGHWTGGVREPTNNITDIIMDSDKTVTAVFVPAAVQRTLTIIAATGGTTVPAAGSYSYPDGTVVSVSAVPAADFTFSGWTDGNTENPRQVVMMADLTIQPVFEAIVIPPDQHVLSIIVIGGGTTDSGYPPGNYTLDEGTDVTVIASPDPDMIFVGWTDELGNLIGTNQILSFLLMKNMTIVANFSEKPPASTPWLPIAGVALSSMAVMGVVIARRNGNG